MTMRSRRGKLQSPSAEAGAIQLLEESFHLVRTTWASGCWAYYLGSIPWMIGLLYFMADMSRSSFAPRDAVFVSVGMGLLWVWKQIWQLHYCSYLWRRLRQENAASPLRPAERFQRIASLLFVQAFRVPFWVIAALFVLPFGWVVATFQNATVLTAMPGRRYGHLRSLIADSLRFSHDDWAQNHLVLLVFSLVAIFTWVNLVATSLVVPALIKSFFGVESVFTTNPAAALGNTTYLLGSVLIVQLALGPLLLAVYTLRCFAAEARTSGMDLLGRLEGLRTQRGARDRRDGIGDWHRIVLFVVLCGLHFFIPASAANTASEISISVSDGEPTRFREEVGRTLEQKKYQWQLPRRLIEEEIAKEETWMSQRMSELAASVKGVARSFKKWWDVLVRKIFDRNSDQKRPKDPKETSWSRGLGSALSITLIVLILGLMGWLGFLLYRRQGRQGEEGESGVDVTDLSKIDLVSEDLVATQLAEDDWLKLAREQIAKGEERLAVRALFLATLAHLGERGLLRIALSKSNGDYKRELSLRAHQLTDLRRAFDENTTQFERAWYGKHILGAQAIESFLQNHALIAADSGEGQPLAPLAKRRTMTSVGGAV